MCDYYSQDDDSCCQSCPITLAGKNCYAIYEVDDATYFDEIENTVSKWAAENPEPEYPTWQDYLHNVSVLYKEHTAGGDVTLIHWGNMMTPISANIAQKLGIKPKEG